MSVCLSVCMSVCLSVCRDLDSGTAESHGGAMKIVAECEICVSEVEVVEEEKQPWH